MNGTQGARAGFGLGRLHHVFSPRRREALVLGALDAGFTHFDTAPAYGDGLSEAEAGRILRSRRSEFTLATKFGIPCSTLGAHHPWTYLATKAARRLFSPRYGSEYLRRDFSRGALSASLDASLLRLGTDHVDYLFVHEPLGLADYRLASDVFDALEEERRKGRVRHYGFAGRAAPMVEAFGAGLHSGDVWQCECGAALPQLLALPGPRREVFVYGLLAGTGARAPEPVGDPAARLIAFRKAYPDCVPVVATRRLDHLGLLQRALVNPLPAPGA